MSNEILPERISGCICELDGNNEPLVADYDLCPVHSGKRREIIEDILFKTGKLGQFDCTNLAEEILKEINKV